ncbi:MAG: hypothetical protein KF708_00560 [Pirellulales bacterium]|nr:hypothetical protein [Pirellulales bacterium]
MSTQILVRIAYLVLCAAATSLGVARAQDDVAHIKSESRRIEGDQQRRYFLVGPKADETPPAKGYGLIVVLPGGDGGAEFHPFVKRLFDQAVPAGYLLAQPVSPRWTPRQQITWPTKKSRVPGMQFTTEEFIAQVMADVEREQQLDPQRVYVLGWSSGGSAAYAATLGSPRVRGAFAAMSIFKPEILPPLTAAQGRAFYIYHSDNDRVVPVRFADAAARQLSQAGADVKVTKYAGGHGWQGDIFSDVRTGIEWLEEHTPASER